MNSFYVWLLKDPADYNDWEMALSLTGLQLITSTALFMGALVFGAELMQGALVIGLSVCVWFNRRSPKLAAVERG